MDFIAGPHKSIKTWLYLILIFFIETCIVFELGFDILQL